MKTIEQLGISPAPWKQCERVPYCEDNIVRCDYNRNDGTPSTRIVAECNAAFSTEQARTDARLIAAAPELYEALRVCVEELNKIRERLPDGEYFDPTMATNMACAALEKAGGRE